MTNPKNSNIRLVMLAAVLTSTLVSGCCTQGVFGRGDKYSPCLSGEGATQRANGREERAARAVAVPDLDAVIDAETVLAQEEMRKMCEQAGIALGVTVEQNHWERFKKVTAAMTVGGAGYAGGTKLGHVIGTSGALGHCCHLDKQGKLAVSKGAAVKGTIVKGVCGTLLPAGLGAAGLIGTWEYIKRSQAMADRQTLVDVLRTIRTAGSAQVTDKDLTFIAACKQRMQDTLNLQNESHDFSTQVSLFERAFNTEGIINCEDKLFTKTMPLQKVGIITHGIYHSPAVPIHEGLAMIMTYGQTHGWSDATMQSLGAAFGSPIIPGAGFPLAYFFYSIVQSVTPKLYEDADIARTHTQRLSEAERNGVRESDFFEYRGKVHASWNTLNNSVFKNDYPICWRHLFNGALGCRQTMTMNGPTYLDEMKIIKGPADVPQGCLPCCSDRRAAALALRAKSLRDFKLTDQQVREIAVYFNKQLVDVTVADLASYRAMKLEESGAAGRKTLNNLATAIKNMAEPGHAESWTYERLQADFGLAFPSVVSRDQATIPDALIEADFAMHTQQGRIQAACFMWALATMGDVGSEVTLALMNGDLIHGGPSAVMWGAPKKTNFWKGAQVYYQNKRYTLVKKADIKNANGEDAIELTLSAPNLVSMLDEEIVLTLEAEVSCTHAAAHGGAHHGVAGAVLGGAGAVITGGSVMVTGGGLALAGAAYGTYSDYVAEATNAEQVGELKIADHFPFHNSAATFAWDCKYKLMSETLETLKGFQQGTPAPAVPASVVREFPLTKEERRLAEAQIASTAAPLPVKHDDETVPQAGTRVPRGLVLREGSFGSDGDSPTFATPKAHLA